MTDRGEQQGPTGGELSVRGPVRALIERTAVASFGASARQEQLEGSVVLTHTVLDDPLAGVQAARLVADLAAGRMREYGLAARAAGRSWDEVADALGLVDHKDDPGGVRAEAAFAWLVEQRRPDPGGPRFGSRPEASWRCGECGARVLDRGPFESHPEDREQGHAPSCARHRAALTAWRDEHDPDEHDQDEQDPDEQDQDEQGPGGGRR